MHLKSNRDISKDKNVTRIIDILIEYPDLIIQVSRIFTDYNTNLPDIEEIKEYVNDLFSSPKVKTPTYINDKLIYKLIKLYMLSTESFSAAKGKVLENIVYVFGPFAKGLVRNQVFVEPTIKDKGYIVGESDAKCDFVFYEKK